MLIYEICPSMDLNIPAKDTLETDGLRTPRQIAQRGRKMSSKKEKHNNDCSNFLEGITQ